MSSGEPELIGGKVAVWREIQRDGAGAVVAAGLRGTRALCSSEHDAIGLEARNRVIARASLPEGQGSIVRRSSAAAAIA